MHYLKYFPAVLLLFLTACQSAPQSDVTEEVEIIEETPVETAAPQIDLAAYEALMDQLQGIEKHYVQDDLYRLESLLQFKQDERSVALGEYLRAKEGQGRYFGIQALDAKNGYMEFLTLQTDCRSALVYWNKSTGAQLIGMTETCCTMFCEGEITFQLYSAQTQSYTELSSEAVIPRIGSILAARAEKQQEGGLDYEFKLPRKGKDLQYCEGEACQTLPWQDGTFAVPE